MKNSEGEEITEPTGILDVFAEFYAALYSSPHHAPAGLWDNCDFTAPPEITLEELHAQLKMMKTGKAADDHHVVVEMLQEARGTLLLGCIAELFTDILQAGGQPPSEWSESFFVVSHKKGDPKLPDNYRPIVLLPILYNLFAVLLEQGSYLFWRMRSVRIRRVSEADLIAMIIC